MSKYWEQRLIKQQRELLDPSIDELDNHLIRLYKSSLDKNKREMVNLYNTLINQSENGTVKINDLYRYNRYWQVRSDLNARLVSLGEKEQDVMNKDLTNMYMKVQKYFNDNPKYLAITKRGIATEKTMAPVDLTGQQISMNGKYVVDAIWCADGKHWSDRIWDNQKALAQDLEEGLFDVIARGSDPNILAKEIESKYEKSYRRAKSLVRTELAHVYNEAAMDRYRDAGIEIVRVVAATEIVRTVGKKTVYYPCDICLEHDGKEYSLNTAIEGDDIPLFHPNCRCTIIPVLGGN